MLSTLRHGARGLARTPQFTIAAVFTLMLAIGTNAAVFSVVQGVLLRPLPYPESDRLVALRHTAPGLGYDDIGISPGLYLLYAAQSNAFESSGLYSSSTVNVTGDDVAPERLEATRVSRDLFATLRTMPAAGRVFSDDELRPGGPPAVILSHGLWQQRFGGRADALGATLRIDGTLHTVVGVMPEDFEFPTPDARLWLPLPTEGRETALGEFTHDAVARLPDNLDAAQAQARVRPLMQRTDEVVEEAEAFTAFIEAGQLAAMVVPLKQRVVGDVSRALWILLGTVAFVFLIACANVANLFLARGEARQKEIAVRAALGAGRRGLIGHYAAESLLIALAGGILGLLLAAAMLGALLRLAPPNIPRLHELGIDPVVMVFTAIVTILAALLLGTLPALRLTTPDILATVGRATRGATASRERHRARQVLVVVQTALALVLLVGSGLMVRSFQHLRSAELGFQPQGALTFRVSLPPDGYADAAAMTQFHRTLLERLRALPGVEQAGATSHPPLAGCCTGTAHVVEDRPVEPGQMPPMFWYSAVTDGYFDAMRIPIVAGRAFDTSDYDDGARTVIVSDLLAREVWGDADPVGRRIRLASTDTSAWFTVVGVAGSVRDRAVEEDPSAMVYYPIRSASDAHTRSMTYVLRARQPGDMAAPARAELWQIDDDLPVAATATYPKIVADSMVRVSFTMLALLVASAIALLLGTVGLYSVISYLVTQRTNEIGIRLALGAQPAQVRRMIVAQGARLAAVGLAVGIAAAAAFTRVMQGMLYGTQPHDPLTFLSVTVLLGGVALLASYVPARRASRIDAARSLQAE